MEEQSTLPKLRRDERTDSGIRILYEDNHLLVVEKPVNLPVQADSSGDEDLLTLLKAYIRARYEKPGEVYLGLVHRLDRPVGGVMVFAKTSKAAARLSALSMAARVVSIRARPSSSRRSMVESSCSMVSQLRRRLSSRMS